MFLNKVFTMLRNNNKLANCWWTISITGLVINSILNYCLNIMSHDQNHVNWSYLIFHICIFLVLDTAGQEVCTIYLIPWVFIYSLFYCYLVEGLFLLHTQPAVLKWSVISSFSKCNINFPCCVVLSCVFVSMCIC